jgi:molybdopterin-guanine dinucleotide biosynthesis protein A
MDIVNAPIFGTACVLAGGRGRRMRGLDKLYLEHDGERLLSRIARQLATRYSDLLAVSSKPEAFTGLGFRVVPDVIKDSGPLGGLYADLLAAKSEWVYLLACDMPFFSGAWVDDLEAAINKSARAHAGTAGGMAERSENGQILVVAARDGRYGTTNLSTRCTIDRLPSPYKGNFRFPARFHRCSQSLAERASSSLMSRHR